MAADDYTLHYNAVTGLWDRVPYASSDSSDVGTSGWYSTTAQAAGMKSPAAGDNTGLLVLGLGALVVVLMGGKR